LIRYRHDRVLFGAIVFLTLPLLLICVYLRSSAVKLFFNCMVPAQRGRNRNRRPSAVPAPFINDALGAGGQASRGDQGGSRRFVDGRFGFPPNIGRPADIAAPGDPPALKLPPSSRLPPSPKRLPPSPKGYGGQDGGQDGGQVGGRAGAVREIAVGGGIPRVARSVRAVPVPGTGRSGRGRSWVSSNRLVHVCVAAPEDGRGPGRGARFRGKTSEERRAVIGGSADCQSAIQPTASRRHGVGPLPETVETVCLSGGPPAVTGLKPRC